MSDKRLTLRLTEYWDNLRGQAVLPQWDRFDTKEFADIWKQCCGWRIEAGEGNTIIFTYDHVGDSVKEAINNDLWGRKFTTSSRVLPGAPLTRNIVGAGLAEQMYASDFKGFPVAGIIKKIDRVINKLVPLIDEGRFENPERKTVRYRSCLMPFGSAEGKVERIVLGLSWKIY
jgi:hypothetical protein